MINQYIIDKDGIVYIGIKNVDNRFCYYISAIQRLHSSKTLNESLQSNKPLGKYEIILKPLKIYSKIRIDNKYHINNIQEVYNEMETALMETTNNLSEKLQHGGNPDHVLITLFLPAIYNVYGSKTLKSTIEELYINPNRLYFLLYDNSRIHDFELTNDNSLNSELYDGFCNIQKEFKNEPLKPSNFDFKISTMSIMFKDINGQSSKYNGHAINVIKGKNDEGSDDLYIIDDSVGISPFQIFLERHKDRIGYWEVKDTTDNLLKQIGGYKDISIDKRLHRDVINIVDSNNRSMIGGDSENEENENENINKYTEEIVNDCAWCPFVSVKDVKLKNNQDKQEIYGIIGGGIKDEEDEKNDEDENDKDKDNKDKNEKNIKDEDDKEENDKNKNDTDEEIKAKKPFKERMKDKLEEFKTPLNKYLLLGIIVLIIIIILILINRYKKVQKNRKRIETYVDKIKDTRKKNVELANKIIKAREIIEKPKKEVATILKSSREDMWNGDLTNKVILPHSRNKTEFFMPKIPAFQTPISRYVNFNFKQ